MAITTNLPNDSRLIAGFNPYYLDFSSSVASYDKANVTIKNSIGVDITTVELIPDASGNFKYNLSGIVRGTVYEFEQFIEPQYTFPSILTASSALFVDDTISRGYLFEINVYNGTAVVDTLITSIPVYFLKASRQILESADMIDYSYNAPSAYMEQLSVNDFQVTCWKGYPIDVQFDSFGSSQQIVFDSLGLIVINSSLPTTLEDRMLRLVLIDSDGNELINLSNTSRYEIANIGASDTFVDIDYRVPKCEGKYFRFTNSNGGQSFWLFTDVYTIEKQRKNKSRVQRNYNDLSIARSRNVSLGNEVNDYLVVTETTSSESDNNMMTALINSPVIELWEGGNKWRRVEMTNNSGGFSSKQISKQFSFTFDLGIIYNQSY
jgi:hypothetical protein